MAVTSTFRLEGAENTRIAISQEGLRTLFGQVEAELYRSETYQRALAGLQKNIGEVTEISQALVKAVGREAIRLALRQLVKQYHVTPASVQQVSRQPENPLLTQSKPTKASQESGNQSAGNNPDPQQVKLSQAANSLPSPEGRPIQTAQTTQPLPDAHSRTHTANQKTQKTPPIESSLKLKEQERETLLCRIGQELQRSRHAKALSLEQLHSQTWVPVHQLKALEAGQVDRLPEDIYVRGFIRRIAAVLNLDGGGMADALLALDPTGTVIPSWQRSPEPKDYLRPMHLYLGYATLMAGAVGGLAWMSHQPLPAELLNQNFSDPAPEAFSPSLKSQALRAVPNQGSVGGAIARPGVTPPETLPF